MANRAEQIRAENLGLIVARRTRHGIYFSLGNGLYRAVLTIDPLHIRTSETEIDATWVPDTGAWQHRIAAADFEVHARSVLNAGDLVQWLDPASGESVTLQPLALNWVNNDNDSRQQITQPQAVVAQPDDCTLNWPNGYGAGRHFRYTVHPTRLIKHLIIDSAANLPAPTVANPYLEIEFILKKSRGVTLYIDGAPWDNSTKTSTVNRIEFRVNSTGETAWLFQAPGATDSEGDATPGIFQLRRQGNTRYCTVRIPKAWIDSAIFPIYLDPTVTIQPDATDGRDTLLYAGLPNNNYGTLTYIESNDGSDYAVSLIAFPLESIPAAATVTTATLSLYEYQAAGLLSWSVFLQRILRVWGESTATWNKYDGTNPWTSAGAQDDGTDRSATISATVAGMDGTAANAFIDWSGATLTDDVAKMRNGTYSNDGWGIYNNAGNSSKYNRFYSSDYTTAGSRPKLVVVYTMPTASVVLQPVRLSATGTVTEGGASPVTGTATVTTQPVQLSASGTITLAGITGTATLTTQPVQLSATGAQVISGTEALSAQPAAISATGKQVFPGTGTLSAQPSQLAGTAAVSYGATGAITAQPVQLSASGSVVPPNRTGTATVTLQPAEIAATGQQVISGTASVQAQPVALSGSGTPEVSGTGTITAQSIALTATGTEAFSGTVAVTAQSAALAATGAQEFSGTGSVLAQASQIAADAWESFEGTAEETAQPAAISGSGGMTISGTGAFTAAYVSLVATGSALLTISGTGSVTAQPASMAAVGTMTTLVLMGFCTLSVQSLGMAAMSAVALGSATLTAAALGSATITVESG